MQNGTYFSVAGEGFFVEGFGNETAQAARTQYPGHETNPHRPVKIEGFKIGDQNIKVDLKPSEKQPYKKKHARS